MSAESLEAAPDIVVDGWIAFRDPRKLERVEEISAAVSTNRVYRLWLHDGSHAVAKVSSYGSYAHFRQDHQRIADWTGLLHGSRYAALLAPVLGSGHKPFLFRQGPSWLALYGEMPKRQSMPRVLDEDDIVSLAREIARFHAVCSELCCDMSPTWKTLGSDIAQLRGQLENPWWCDARNIGNIAAEFLREHCDAFLLNADETGYHHWPKIPVLIDWNIGNFSVERITNDTEDELRLFSRWDYDWFRVETRMLDFYFLARVVSDVGDRTDFSYSPNPLLEPRFQLFLRAYHELNPLQPTEISFLAEAYRFFLLNYVIREGEHFFRPEICNRLRSDVVNYQLPALSAVDLSPLIDAVTRPLVGPRSAARADRTVPAKLDHIGNLQIAPSFFEVAQRYRAIFFDAFGVLKTAAGLLPDVPEVLTRLLQAEIDAYVVTNDASRSPEAMSRRYGKTPEGPLVPARRIVSSGMLAGAFLASNVPAGCVGYLGRSASAFYIEAAGHQAVPVADCEQRCDELQAFVFLDDEGFDWFSDLNCVLNLLRDYEIPVVVANRDMAYPVDSSKLAIAVGSLGGMLEGILGQNFTCFGKPDTEIFDYAFALSRRDTPSLTKSDILMVGDTLATDIAGGQAFGIDTALVLSGNTKPREAERTIKDSGITPTFICESIRS